jgi:hypothetical protein
MGNIVHVFNACLMTRLLITLKRLTVIEYSILNTLNIYKDYDCHIYEIDNGISKLFLE